MSKRKRESEGEPNPKKKKVCTCILHFENIDHGDFVSLNNAKTSPEEQLLRLKSIRERRLKEPLMSPRRMEDACMRIPDTLNDPDAGYHRQCYMKFTGNLHRLTALSTEITKSVRSPRKHQKSTRLPAECIFCQKLEIKVARKTERCVPFSVFKDENGRRLREQSWKNIERRALQLGETRVHRIFEGEDLYARNARYHPSCRRKFNLKYLAYKRKHDKTQPEASKDNAHQKAFQTVINFIKTRVIGLNEVTKLTTLRLIYRPTQELEKHSFPNPDYILASHEIAEEIAFASMTVKGCVTTDLIYSKKLSVEDAVAYAFQLGSEYKYQDVAMSLRSDVQRAFKESNDIPWPPTADDLDLNLTYEGLPSDLLKFMNLIISGNSGNHDETYMYEQSSRVALSITQVSHSFIV